jgi:anaerobic magnesium-protoporphyrin IX monomethyl ester cyclase
VKCAAVPRKLILGLTYACQARCLHCSCARHSVTPRLELTTAEVRRTINTAAGLGVEEVNLFGGEPTLRADFLELLEHAAAVMPQVSIDSNGVRLSDAVVQVCKRNHVDALYVSLAGASAATHDAFQGAMTFTAAVTGIRRAIAAHVPVWVSLCAGRDNLLTGELERTIAFARSLGVRGVRIALPNCSGRWLGRLDMLLSSAEVSRVRRLAAADAFVGIVEEESGCFVRCHAVHGSFYVSPYGEVQPCNFVPLDFGNVREEPLELILERMAWHSRFQPEALRGSCPMQRPEFITELERRLDPKSQLVSARELPTIRVARACNNHCEGCISPAGDATFTKAEVMAQIARLPDDFRAVLISGGEPTLHADLPEIVRTIVARGYEPILCTNARVFAYAKRARAMVRLGVRHVRVPFFGLQAAAFERRTGVEGSHDQTTSGIRQLVEAGVFVEVELPAGVADEDAVVASLISLGVGRVLRSTGQILPRCAVEERSSPAVILFDGAWLEKPDFAAYDVVLFYPHDRSLEQRLQLPHGLLALAAPLLRAGFRVKIVDARVSYDWQEELAQTLRRSPAALCVGITCFLGPQIAEAFAAARLIRELAPGLPVVFGGAFPSLVPEEVLEAKTADVVVVGEGEASFLSLAEALRDQRELTTVPGLVLHDQGTVVHTARPPAIGLDELLPTPYELLPLERYRRFRGGIQWAVYSSRGCPHACSFCAVSQINERKWRAMGTDRILAEIDRLVVLGAREVEFCEDNFFVDLERCRELARRFIQSGRTITWGASCRVDSVLRLSDDDLRLLRQAGLARLYIGAESGSDRVLALLNKKTTRADILAANRRLRDAEIVPEYIFMVGFPSESEAEREQTLAIVEELRQEHPGAWFWRMNHYVPYPKTPLYELARAHGFVPPAQLEGWAALSWHRSALADLIPYQVAF